MHCVVLLVFFSKNALRSQAFAYSILCVAGAGTQLLLRVFGLHSRAEYEVYGFANGPDDGSTERAVVQRTCDVFRGEMRSASSSSASSSEDVPLHARTPTQVAQLMASDGIDVLVDYDGAHDFNSMAVLALRPAPVQISFLGFAVRHSLACTLVRLHLCVISDVCGGVVQGTTGAKGVVDYLITDHFITPPERAQGLCCAVSRVMMACDGM
jgi:protein O-GlcNAc transferase